MKQYKFTQIWSGYKNAIKKQKNCCYVDKNI